MGFDLHFIDKVISHKSGSNSPTEFFMCFYVKFTKDAAQFLYSPVHCCVFRSNWILFRK